ncbi:hypothetical protein A3B45_01735 [Candidatus Daviesbacteria bacterium RIFCSPLOWO2_01_FULL_39_12]|uniref:Type II secretion system protein GspG C-terminal domain-containing protein n=1 Tax=Candidatus Daviesbacteria bacterium RIFCSPLOWO2_01_FULL_39_12 TaxID=1797785 RepID=A0A1F5KTK7_9BACT|nr:MAG: hypothetical protein A3B45_01735 [Candidatus Daviesbacteria bacterium RIFCSPLOWO2_01_FULL_39_12]
MSYSALSKRCKPKGFTLIELLVVISIIAILSVVGITIFTNVQKGARDAKRRADINAIANALEVNYGTCPSTTNSYCALPENYFSSGGIPIDPSISRDSLTLNNADVLNSKGFGYIYIPGIIPLGHRSSSIYKVCADLESVGGWDGTQQDYCRSNQQSGLGSP